jgi:hypothetical protein
MWRRFSRRGAISTLGVGLGPFRGVRGTGARGASPEGVGPVARFHQDNDSTRLCRRLVNDIGLCWVGFTAPISV